MAKGNKTHIQLDKDTANKLFEYKKRGESWNSTILRLLYTRNVIFPLTYTEKELIRGLREEEEKTIKWEAYKEKMIEIMKEKDTREEMLKYETEEIS